ncbi:hypothetical protein AN221_32390 [Streptomyces nanshensis]|uniref:Uncharacterized protein n=1 Tax=Streptomyces nanshensis TaxID=518642 RepID=A0A1E7LJB4_9ACTN|nr:hypothetical protein AN221_32390 [Streptomyces nanshensis]
MGWYGFSQMAHARLVVGLRCTFTFEQAREQWETVRTLGAKDLPQLAHGLVRASWAACEYPTPKQAREQ